MTIPLSMAFNLPKYELRQGRVNKGHPGILLISEKYEFLYNKANKEQSIFYYYCKFRRTKGIVCPAKASIVKYEGEDGETRFLLKMWSEDTRDGMIQPSNSNFCQNIL